MALDFTHLADPKNSAGAQAVITAEFPETAIVHRAPAGMSFAELAASADVVHGHELEKNKGTLVGIPFVVTSVTFRDGVLRNKQPSNYVSAEIVVADRATLVQRVKAGRLDASQAERITPGEAIVINDGSTGIARQLTAYLHSRGLIEVPDGPEAGAAGDCRYDTYRAGWLSGYDVDDPDPTFKIALMCPRGLRVSEYESDQSAGESTTYYLA